MISKKTLAAIALVLTPVGALAALLPAAEDPPAELYVRTTPAGATLTLDGKKLGTSPNIFKVVPGKHELLAVMDGYKSTKRDIVVPATRIERVILTLESVTPRSIAQDGWGKSVNEVQSRLQPGVFRDGYQWLSFDLRNDSREQFIQLGPGGMPTGLLIDDVPYGWSGDGQLPVCKPGQSTAGGKFKLDKHWIVLHNYSGFQKLELKPGKHTVKAIVYAIAHADERPRLRRRTRVLSNPIEIEILSPEEVAKEEPADDEFGDSESTEATPIPDAKAGAYTVSLEHQGAIKERTRLAHDRFLTTQTEHISRQGPAGRGQAGQASGGGSASGTYDRPNYAIALRLSPSPKGMQVFLDGATAIDSSGGKHNTVDLGKPFRMTVPAYEAVHPGCAGAYFAFDETPAAITKLSGTLLLVPSQIHEARFSGKQLRENGTIRTKVGLIRMTSYREDDEGLSVSVSMPSLRAQLPIGPMRSQEDFLKRIQARRNRPEVSVVLIDSQGVPHLPKSERGGGSSGRVSTSNGVRHGSSVPTESRDYTFAALSDSLKVDAVVIRIVKATGEPRRIPFAFR
jgi:hypothetical protein